MTLTKKVREQRIRFAARHPQAQMWAEEVIYEALRHRVYMAWSGGRCSTVALWLAIQKAPDIPVVFNNTGVEYPETVAYVHRIAEEWRLNFHELKPETNFWEIVKEHGFPQLRGSAHKMRKPACCELLKEAPARRFARSGGYDGFITGIRVEESRPRMFGVAQKGLVYYADRDRLWKFHPVALWSEEYLVAFSKIHRIEHSPLYEPHEINGRMCPALSRVGCMPCTGFTRWQEQFAEQNPVLFRMVNDAFQRQKGEPTLWEFYEQNDTCRQEPEI